MSARNSKSSMKIIIPGPLTTVQDLGRIGHMAEGFPVCGAADKDAAEIANVLVGNERTAAILEITLGGFGAQLLCDALVAVTGAEAPVYINGELSERYRAHRLSSGDYIYIGYASSGCRAYLAVSGGIDVPVIMGSRSTFLKTAMGGFEGRKLKSGDMLGICPSSAIPDDLGARSAEPTAYPKSVRLRAVPGPQDDMFPKEELYKFFSQEYTVTPSSDRMGLRLDGEPISAVNGTDIISDGIAYGSVQVSRDGKPIILGADRQTTGGYAKPATVISADMSCVGQLVPGCKVRFVPVTPEDAENAATERERMISSLIDRIK